MIGVISTQWASTRRYHWPARLALWLCLVGLLLAVPGQVAGAMGTTGGDSDWLPLTSFCHASTALPAPAQDHVVPDAFLCGGAPEGYQRGSLWLSAGARVLSSGGRTPVLMVHSSRFDRLLVGFRYADGAIVWQDVHSGNFAGHWRLGGQIGFDAPLRDARLTGLVLRFDRLASAEVLRLRLVQAEVSSLQGTALASLIGAALMLLVIGAIYNLALGIAVRRMFPLLQGVWSATLALWGAMWSQLHLFVVPGMAGTLSSQVCTVLGTALITLTALSMISAIAPGDIPRWLRRIAVVLALVVGVLGVPLGLMRAGAIELLANVTGALFFGLVVVMLCCLAVAWRRGSPAARTFAGAWSPPLLVMSLSGYLNLEDTLWGGGPQMLVLLSGAWQTVWLSIAATRRFTLLRQERDRAVAAEALAQDLARRDPLTGLSNRRGFVERITPLLVAHDGGGEFADALALLVLDIDQFKAVNDRHGHDIGDAVLIAIARRLARWDSPAQIVGRLGGEEFAILIAGMGRFAAHSFAESVRQAIATCDHDAALRGEHVTVSIGMVMARPGDTFSTLYRAADMALYAAKHQGRNRVIIGRAAGPEPDAPLPPVAAGRG